MRGSGRLGAGLAALLLATGCDLTLPWSAGSRPDAPRALTISLGGAAEFDVVYLSWSTTLLYEQYELQWRVGAAGWQGAAGWTTLGPTHGRVALDAGVPENTPIAFRLRGTLAGRSSDWSDEVAFVRGIRPPSGFTAEMGMSSSWLRSGPVTLSWTNESAVATEILLERAPVLGSGQPTGWSALPGAALGAGRYVDHLLEEGVAYAYRVRAGMGGVWSAPQELRTEPVALAAPWGLRAVKVDGGVELSWTNQSPSAEEASVTVYATGAEWSGMSFPLPSVVDSWLHPAPVVWPSASYQVTVGRPGEYLYASTARTCVEPFTLAGPPALAASALRLPEAEWYARDMAGRFHLAQGVYQSPRIHRATDTGYETHVLADANAFAAPGILADAQGAPHTVFVRGSPYGASEGDLVHAWWDGGAWRSEVVATDVIAPWSSVSPRAWFGLGEGGVQVVYRRSEPFPAMESLVHVAGAVKTVLTTPSVPDFQRWSAAVGVGADGTAYVARLGGSASLSQTLVLLATRSAAGVWSDEVVPTGAASSDGPWLVAGSGGDVALFHGRDGQAPGDRDLRVVRKQGGTWREPELVATRPFDGYTLDLAVSGTPDLDRLALSTWSIGRTDVHVRDGAGWKGVTVGPASVRRAGLGFAAAGDAWALFPHDSAVYGLVPYSLFEELR